MLLLREGDADDLPFLRHMLMQAYHWNQEGPLPSEDEFLSHPNIRERLEDWRPDDGDRAVIAELDDAPIGAAWYRFGTEENHAYGYINPQTPELGIGILPGHRSKGVGRKLIDALIELARQESTQSISLCVDPANYARKLYESVGFEIYSKCETSLIMSLQL